MLRHTTMSVFITVMLRMEDMVIDLTTLTALTGLVRASTVLTGIDRASMVLTGIDRASTVLTVIDRATTAVRGGAMVGVDMAGKDMAGIEPELCSKNDSEDNGHVKSLLVHFGIRGNDNDVQKTINCTHDPHHVVNQRSLHSS